MTKHERHILVASLSLTSALLTYGVTRIVFPDMPTALALARTHYVNVQVGLSTTAGILVSLFLAAVYFAGAIQAELVPNGVSPPGICADNTATSAESSTCVEVSNEKLFVSRLVPPLYFIIAFGMLSAALRLLLGPVGALIDPPNKTSNTVNCNAAQPREFEGVKQTVRQTSEKWFARRIAWFARRITWYYENFSLGVHHDHIGRWLFPKLLLFEVVEVCYQGLTL